MAISDAVARNFSTIFVGLMACFEAYGFASGRRFSGGYVVIVSTAAVILFLVATLTWDVSRKATCAFHRDHADSQEDVCKGGICWHGVAPRSPASQVRVRLPSHLPLAPL
ncbi:hypothetical protein AAZX31_06G022100 [Glycine max]|uniref:Uncharacterized protein n=2 Tax=Glycine subgen. Soja TaxID=1462606 RepID=I1K7J1_SOYBN|nr:uncharacterized protein LOC100814019 [Glycine max]XP_028234241.1 uncharacterized protein LOC114414085 [Glycine soja]KAH1123828.1 hypothetical protein GYH30_013859 [Glycine max]KRH51696.1 hypothetical protein GLYMA_06G023700v4 [Glycine max]RZC05405.1 hypothetical protein D0Y65_013523 [Glycine soja]|eukprot:XP_003527613.1 uncharacterized protein LOC100814019 [Glycine max]